MLKYFTVILMLFSSLSFGQELSANAEASLQDYIILRDGYKHSETKQFSRTEQFEMDDFCFAMEKKFPDAWQTDFAWFLNGHFYSNQDKLLEAYKKAPTDKRVVKAVFGYYIMTYDYGKQKEIASTVAKYYSSNELSYYEDVLPSSGVVIASSLKDAIPLYILQIVKGKGKNVTIVTMDFLINKDYRSSMADKLGTGSANFFGDEKTFIQTALSNTNVHLSTTVSQAYISGMGDNAFVTGLFYQGYVKDQKKKLEKFWIRLANKNFSSMSLNSSEKRLYTNYLPPLMTLYKMKLAVGVEDEALRKAIELISSKVEQTKTVNKILRNYEDE
jgi:hypothetical protein